MKKLLPVLLLIAAFIAVSPAPAYACENNIECGYAQDPRWTCNTSTGQCVDSEAALSNPGSSASASNPLNGAKSAAGGSNALNSAKSAVSGGTATADKSTLGGLLQSFIGIINQYLVPVIFAIAFIVFLWGIVQYFILGATNEESQKKGRQLIIYGLIGFVVMVSVWGIVSMFRTTFGFDSNVKPPLPTFGSGASANTSVPVPTPNPAR